MRWGWILLCALWVSCGLEGVDAANDASADRSDTVDTGGGGREPGESASESRPGGVSSLERLVIPESPPAREPTSGETGCADGPGAASLLSFDSGLAIQDVEPFRSATVGDLNGDGQVDFISVRKLAESYELSWEPNAGAGSFGAPLVLAEVPLAVTQAIADDLDDDGDLDVLLMHPENALTWFESANLESFSAHPVPLTGAPRAVVVDNLDKDGAKELLAATWEGIFRVELDGTTLQLTEEAEKWAAAVELDGDHDLDLVTQAGRWFENVGDGYLSHEADVMCGAAVRAADLDLDGDVDLVATSSTRVRWYENDGAGHFVPHEIASSGVKFAELVDVDGDGDTDILGLTWSRAVWFDNLSGQGFRKRSTALSGSWDAVAVAHVDSDALPDLIAWKSSGQIAWVPSTPNTTCTPPDPVVQPACGPGSVYGMAGCTEVDDCVDNTSCAVFEAHCNRTVGGHFCSCPAGMQGLADTLVGLPLQLWDGWGSVCALRLDDLDGDGDLDISFGDGWLDNDGPLVWVERAGFPLGAKEPPEGCDVCVDTAYADLDGDGDPDRVDASNGVRVFENLGAGAEASPLLYGYDPGPVRVGDLTADGRPDLVTESAWYENLGSLRFRRHALGLPDVRPCSIRLGDVDGDGDLDLVYLRMDLAVMMAVLEWRGCGHPEPHVCPTGYWPAAGGCDYVGPSVGSVGPPAAPFVAPSETLWTADGPRALAIGDFDGDAGPDLAAAAYHDDQLVWLKRVGDEVLAVPVAHTRQGIVALRAADLDGDGDIDLVSGSLDDASVAWHENTGDGFVEHVIGTGLSGIGGLAVGDLDGDGDLDLVVAASYSERLVRYDNTDDLGFVEQTIPIPSGTQPVDVVIGDFDGVAGLDVAASCAAGYLESVDFGYGYARTGPVALGDLDGDGDLDLVGVYGDTLRWWANSGSGTGPGTTIAPVNDTLSALEVADVNGDGRPDVVAGFSGSSVLVFTNLLTGFEIRVVDTVGAFDLLVADLDGDDQLDLVTAETGNDRVSWRRGGVAAEPEPEAPVSGWSVVPNYRFRGFFRTYTGELRRLHDGIVAISKGKLYRYRGDGDGELQEFLLPEAPSSVTTFDVGDLDGDGDDDLVVGRSSGIGLSWLLNDEGRWRIRHIADLCDVEVVAAADMDADGDLDVVVGQPGQVRWFESTPSAWVSHQVSNDTTDRLAVGDFDNDGFSDVVYYSKYRDALRWARQLPNATFEIHLLESSKPGALDVGDFDGDGVDEVLVVAGDRLTRWRYEAGRLAPHIVSTGVDRASVADIDEDGDDDILAVGDRVWWFENTGLGLRPHEVPGGVDGASAVAAGIAAPNGAPTLLVAVDAGIRVYDLPQTPSADSGYGAPALVARISQPVAATPADADGDGDLDVLVASEVGGTIRWFENAAGAFVPADLVAEGLAGLRIATVADMDGDDDLDVVAGAGGAVTLFERAGAGYQAQEVFTAPGGAVLDLSVADFDGDGAPDVVVARSEEPALVHCRQDGGFAPTVLAGSRIASLAVGDLSGAGAPDLVVLDRMGHEVRWHQNQDGALSEPTLIDSGVTGALTVVAADIDADGVAEVFVGTTTAVIVYRRDEAAFQRVSTVEIGPARSLSVADLDDDGAFDLVVGGDGERAVTLLSGMVGPAQAVSTGGPDAWPMAVADINGDGGLDLLVTSYGGGRVTWLQALPE